MTDADVSVKDFGAKGDGKHDDSEAIQQAVHNVMKNGGKVYLPSGNYLLKKTIELPQGVQLIGSGSSNRYEFDLGSNLVQGSPDMQSIVRVVGKDVLISGIGIKGDQRSSTDGILIDSADYVTITHTLIAHMGRHGIVSHTGVVHRILSNTIYQCEGSSLEGTFWDSFISGNDVGYGKLGILVKGGPTRIIGNKFWLQKEHAIWLAGQKSMVLGNDIQYAGGIGVYLNSKDNIVEANMIQCPGQNDAMPDYFKTAIYVNSSQNTITSNRLVNENIAEPSYKTRTAAYGIYVAEGGHSQNIISNNATSDANSKGIFIAGSTGNIVLAGNIE
ncbi:glycosyl hydrolase family 28-related protein [Brevibacillus panacihumi]|nr:glycosyl hydrolase family 28-related protein [Brevibacillus panacihumi]